MTSATDPGWSGWGRILEEWFAADGDIYLRVHLRLAYTRRGHAAALEIARSCLAQREQAARP